MSRRSWILLCALAAIWGGSYLLIKLALDDLSPAMVVFVRTLLAALVLMPVGRSSRSPRSRSPGRSS